MSSQEGYEIGSADFGQEEEEHQGEGYGNSFRESNDPSSGIIPPSSDDDLPPPWAPIEQQVTVFTTYVWGPAFEFSNRFRGVVCLELPRAFLPLCLQAVCGFFVHEQLLRLEITLSSYSWRQPPGGYDLKHPTLGLKFFGSCLVQNVIKAFFDPNYQPKPQYRSAPFILAAPAIKVDAAALASLCRQGFSDSRADRALTLCNNSLTAAQNLLNYGVLSSDITVTIPLSYDKCPPLYLLLEIADALLGLQECCCICGKDPVSRIKPTICDQPLCTFQAQQIGIGLSVWQELSRDPPVADLVLSALSVAIGTTRYDPRNPLFSEAEVLSVLERLPATVMQFRPATRSCSWTLASNGSISMGADFEPFPPDIAPELAPITAISANRAIHGPVEQPGAGGNFQRPEGPFRIHVPMARFRC
jgi:hypothetical protein